MGSGGEYVKAGKHGSFIALGWNETGNLSAIVSLDADTAKEQLTSKYIELKKGESRVSIGQTVGQLLRFIHMTEGDITLVPDGEKSTVLIGKIIGNYYFDEAASGLCNYKHKRNVEWISEIPRNKFSTGLRNSLGSLLTLSSLDEHASEIERLIGETDTDGIEIEDSGEYEIPLNERKVHVKSSEPTIKDLCDRINKGRLVVRADFQRNYVWRNKPKLRSKLIESVLLGLPIPEVYTAEEPDGKELVIDGQQRLLTFDYFRKKEEQFPLSGLTILPDLNGYTYEMLGNESDPIIHRM